MSWYNSQTLSYLPLSVFYSCYSIRTCNWFMPTWLNIVNKYDVTWLKKHLTITCMRNPRLITKDGLFLCYNIAVLKRPGIKARFYIQLRKNCNHLDLLESQVDTTCLPPIFWPLPGCYLLLLFVCFSSNLFVQWIFCFITCRLISTCWEDPGTMW